ncbi:hypothetical protein LTR56_010959 [Elasticomyces elasticus]|nr:hypothetical protein LTR56_010959 [Elasticomyces elasticus]KAK3662657.1 hypothetical protein LTR22_006507 [Elasticomyces elasticus]KAK4926559.1 hypothetical protein LTR49_006493 [Elasticomyces elasticus]KAK5760652.1 hypothetical protein LTS12_009189 [Elasticomyces elasticus]
MPGRRRVRVLAGVLVFIVLVVLYTRKSEVEQYGEWATEKVVGGGSVLRPNKPVVQEAAAEKTASKSVAAVQRPSYEDMVMPQTTSSAYIASPTTSSAVAVTRTPEPTLDLSHQLPPITSDDELVYEIGEGRIDNEEPLISKTSAIHWVKQTEHFPISTTRQLPTGTSKPIPRIQYSGPGTFGKADPERLSIIKAAALHAWTGYRDAAWGMDEVKPISGLYNNPFNGWGATLVDSLDTLWIMGLTSEFDEAVSFVAEIDFTTSTRSDIPVFETTIRYLGGLIAAYDISGAKAKYRILLDKSVELAEVLYSAFDTPNRMPQTYYRWKPAFASQPHKAMTRATMAELGSLSLEFTRLAQLTGEPKYYDAIARITDAFEVWQNDTRVPGMWPTTVDASGCAKPGTQSFGGETQSLQHLVPGGEGQMMEALAPVRGGAGANKVTSVGSNLDTKQQAEVHAKLDADELAAKRIIDSSAKVKRQLDGANTKSLPSTARDAVIEKITHNVTAVQEDPRRQVSTWQEPACIPQGLASPSKRGIETFTLGGQSDSTYEYLPKMHMLLGGLEAQYEAMYIASAEAVKRDILFRPMTPDNRDILISGTLRVAVNATTGEYIKTLVPEGEHLTCFAGGMFALAGKIFDRPEDVDIGRKLTDGCVWAYESTTMGIMPEVFSAMKCPEHWEEECKWNQTAYWHELDPWEETRTRIITPVVAAAATVMSSSETEEVGVVATTASLNVVQAVQTKVAEGATRVVQKLATSAEEFEDIVVDLKDAPAGLRLAKRQFDNDIAVAETSAPPANPTPAASPSPSTSSRSSSSSNALPTVALPIYTPKPPLSHHSFVQKKISDERLPPGMTKIRDRRYILRPEAIESVFYLYRITGEQHWRDVGWKMFTSIQEVTQAGFGNAAIDDVTKMAPELKDTMESFWLAETLKYFWLLFEDSEVGSLDEWVLNTEAHFFRRPGYEFTAARGLSLPTFSLSQHRILSASAHRSGEQHPFSPQYDNAVMLTSITRRLVSSTKAVLKTRPLHQTRTITNATKPDFIPSLLDVRRVPAKPGNWHPTLVHSSGQTKFTVIRLAPAGGEVPNHYHNEGYDYFLPLSGEAVIETKTKDGVEKDYEMKPGSFLSVGPGDVHRVRNVSETEEFVFFIAQAPREKYDFVAVA